MQYQKLGKSRSIMKVEQLFYTNDHLLLETINGFKERYSRFYFTNINGFSMTKTMKNFWFNIVAVATIFITVISANISIEFLVLFAPLSMLAIGVIIYNLINGASCKFFIHTGVQRKHLASISNIKKANKIMDILTPLISTIQITEQKEKIQNQEPIIADSAGFTDSANDDSEQ